MNKEFFVRLKEQSRAIGETLKRKPPIETDIVDLVTHIDDYRGRKVTVIGDAEFSSEKVVPKFSSGLTMHPITVSETQTYHRLYPHEIAEAEVNVLFQEGIENVSGETPQQGDIYEGRVAVTGRVQMETVKEKDEVLGKVKVPRPYIKATTVKPLE